MLFLFLKAWGLDEMKSKKAFLLGEYTLKIIIGVLSLLLLIYLLYSLHSNSQDERDLKMAEATLDELVGKMEEAKTGDSQTLTLLNPVGWNIYTFRKDFQYKPIACEDNCICVCEHDFNKINAKNCDAQGVCKNFNEETYFSGPTRNFMNVFGDFIIKYENNKFTILENE